MTSMTIETQTTATVQTIEITPTTDLAPLVGVRVQIIRDVPGYGRSIHTGIFESLSHGLDVRVVVEDQR